MRTKDENKRHAIRNATVVEVVTGGISSTSIAKIAARAGLSQGTIYLYFPSKEALLQNVYLEIKRDIHTGIMSTVYNEDTSEQNLRRMWFGLIDYAKEHPDDFAFSELVSAAQLLGSDHIAELEKLAGEIGAVIQQAVDDGTLIDAPVSSLLPVLVAPAIQSARTIAISKKDMDHAQLGQIFEIIWRGVARTV